MTEPTQTRGVMGYFDAQFNLKPCPCCGGTAVFNASDAKHWEFQIECLGCHLVMPGDFPEDIAHDWNKRVIDAEHL